MTTHHTHSGLRTANANVVADKTTTLLFANITSAASANGSLKFCPLISRHDRMTCNHRSLTLSIGYKLGSHIADADSASSKTISRGGICDHMEVNPDGASDRPVS